MEVRVEVRDPKNAVGQSILDLVVTTTEPTTIGLMEHPLLGILL